MSPVTSPDFTRLQQQLPEGELTCDPLRLNNYAGDKWHAVHQPDAVALPASEESVCKILRFADDHRIPVTPRGAGYGYVGGCVPVRGGIVLSLEKMNRILEIHKTDFVARIQPAVNTRLFQEAVEEQNLFYPPDPASRADCSLGGNIATNAGGPRCLKYGVTRDYVLGLTVVLANGNLVKLGSRTHKNKTGFDLHRLFVGSEGLLGVVTEATLKLLPLPTDRACLSVGFHDSKAATDAITTIFEAGILPCALEIADEFTIAAAQKRTGSEKLRNCKAHLIVELDGAHTSVQGEIAELEQKLRTFNPQFLEKALGRDQVEELWALRREFSFSLRDTGLTKINEDIVVPRSRLTDLFAFASGLQERHGIKVACFGHAGDGNIHVNLMLDTAIASQVEAKDSALNELFQQILAWGGVITGEHGIGLAKKPWWSQAISAEADRLHKSIKNALDPKGILNPGKFLG